jgi:phosphatidylserine/phosphatidylglycerophosphate/cardiolipin synthase-like enzyme
MTYDSSYSAELSELVSAGVGAHVYPDTSSALYIHAKVIVVDAGTAYEKAFIGSENFSAASMDHNRELGIITTDPTVVNKLASVLGQDYTGAPPFNATTPPEPTTTTAAAGGQVSNTTPSGHYYKPGEYCPHKDLGKTIADPYGTMTCKEPPGGGQPRWVAA